MADADDFDVEELRALLRGEPPTPAGAKAGSRPAAGKASRRAAKAKAAPAKGTARSASAKSPDGKSTAVVKRAKR